MPVLPRVNDYDSLSRQFRWSVPARYNIGADVCDRWAEKEPDRVAILHARPDGRDEQITYVWLRERYNTLDSALRASRGKGGDPREASQCMGGEGGQAWRPRCNIAAAPAAGCPNPHRDLQARWRRPAAR